MLNFNFDPSINTSTAQKFMHFGSTIIHLTSVDSTNNYAAKLLKEGMLSSGAVIMADIQTAGKGQRGAVWDSTSGQNLLFSIVLKQVNLSVTEQFILNQMSALAIHDFLGKIGISAAVKWPNDVIVGEKKIAGVLIESFISGSSIKDVIIGIGLNVNQAEFSGLRATSIRLELDRDMELRAALNALLHYFDFWWAKLKNGEIEDIQQAYLRRLLGHQEWRSFLVGGEKIEGKIEGVDEWGKLRVMYNGEVHSFDIKEITYCW